MHLVRMREKTKNINITFLNILLFIFYFEQNSAQKVLKIEMKNLESLPGTQSQF